MKSREKFVQLAEQRTNKALKMIDLIGNLSNKTNYSYSDDDIKKIIKALQFKIKEVESRFELSEKNAKGKEFKL